MKTKPLSKSLAGALLVLLALWTQYRFHAHQAQIDAESQHTAAVERTKETRNSAVDRIFKFDQQSYATTGQSPSLRQMEQALNGGKPFAVAPMAYPGPPRPGNPQAFIFADPETHDEAWFWVFDGQRTDGQGSAYFEPIPDTPDVESISRTTSLWLARGADVLLAGVYVTALVFVIRQSRQRAIVFSWLAFGLALCWGLLSWEGTNTFPGSPDLQNLTRLFLAQTMFNGLSLFLLVVAHSVRNEKGASPYVPFNPLG